jgi:membrane-bound lytic murein transglycosylase MltF
MTAKKRNIAGIVGFILFSFLVYFITNIIFAKEISVRDYPEIQASGVLNIVTEYNSVDYYVSGDSIAGVQYDLANYVKERSGLEVKIHLENNLETSIEKLQNNVYDIIAQNIPITNESKKDLNFTIPIAKNRQVLVQRKPVENDTIPFISNQIDLGNKTIHVAKNSPAILRLKNLVEEIAEIIYIEEIEHYTAEHLIYMVHAKDIDYAVVDNEIALKNAVLFPEIDFTTEISFTQFQAWVVRKNAPILLDSLNTWLQNKEQK